ncbi:HNH endonuclease family protein [Hoeflea sp.]|uniref:HNH endonuclease family protein n=1 Tax=Hoeflea sp. TaxID=1940281 RepID=UPI003B01FEDD
MKIRERKLTVRELVEGYSDDGEGGVTGYGGRLDIRPSYQREFVYRDKQRDAVINTVRNGLPLNTMYWNEIDGDRFEIIDGQQRTISICQYVEGVFSIDGLGFHNLQADQQEQILNYELMIYTCSGTDSQRLEWFEVINIAGEILTDQELRNAVYHGPWLSDAKKYFSRPNCPAHNIGNKYLKGSAIRQDYLETALKWIHDGEVKDYMSEHQHDKTAVDLWNYFQSVIAWVAATFPNYRREMKGVAWGPLYNRFGKDDLDPSALEADIKRLLMDDDVTRKAGVWRYVLDGDERHLSIRTFTDSMKREAFERQEGLCPICKEQFDLSQMEADHIDPWSQGGKTTAENCQMLCKPCNRRKSDR